MSVSVLIKKGTFLGQSFPGDGHFAPCSLTTLFKTGYFKSKRAALHVTKRKNQKRRKRRLGQTLNFPIAVLVIRISVDPLMIFNFVVFT